MLNTDTETKRTCKRQWKARIKELAGLPALEPNAVVDTVEVANFVDQDGTAPLQELLWRRETALCPAATLTRLKPSHSSGHTLRSSW